MIVVFCILFLIGTCIVGVTWCHFVTDMEIWEETKQCYGCSDFTCELNDPSLCDRDNW